jgi:hypothetical protein
MHMGRFGAHSKCFKTRNNYVTTQKHPQLALVTALG